MEHYDQTTGEILGGLDIQMSAQVADLFAALAKAQAEIKGALKDSTNPHFKSRYADLASVVEACSGPLAKHGIARLQIPYSAGENIGVTTILGHSSGQWISGRLAVKPMKFDAQGAGSVVTYLRRYALAAMVGVAPEDDDGEAAAGRGNGQEKTQIAPATRAATPAAVPSQPASAGDKQRARAEAIRDMLKKTSNLDALAAIMDGNREEIETFPENTRAFLKDYYEKRCAAMTEAA